MLQRIPSSVRWALGILLVGSLIGGLLGSLSSDASFFQAFGGSLKSLLITGAVILVVFLLVYAPWIYLIRRRWTSYKSRHVFANDQTEKSLTKFIANGPALFGVITIVYALLIATFGYYISPDPTNKVNRQVAELEKHEPGFEIDFLRVRQNRREKKTSALTRLTKGITSQYQEIPINSYEIQEDSVVVMHYRGKEFEAKREAYELVNVVYAKSFQDSEVRKSGDTYSFRDVEDNQIEVSRADLVKAVEKKHVVRRKFWFGTDQSGRDYLSRIILGTRISISVGFLAVTVALLIGITLGAIAGYFRGRIDDLIMWFINIFWSIPTLLLVFPIAFAFDMKEWVIYLAVGLTMWVDIARIVRGQVMSVREMEYVEAAKSLGFGHFRTIFRHILPNISGPVIVVTAANFAYAILIEAGLSFLGIGAQPPKPSWGQMIAKNKDNIAYGDPHLALIPGFCIVLLVLSFFLIGNGLRDALDARTRVES